MNIVLIWDFDGTLGYRQGNWEEAIFELSTDKITKSKSNLYLVSKMLQIGFPWHEAQKSYVSINNKDNWWNYVKPRFIDIFISLGYSEYEASINADLMPEQYAKQEKWKLFEDTVPSLSKLQHKHWRNILVTNNIPEFPKILNYLNLDKYFENVFVSSLVGYNKPNILILKDYLNELNYNSRVFVIGDREDSDLAFANALKVECILVRGIIHRNINSFANLNELTAYLLSLNL